MARYINKYADETAIHTAVDNQELLNPYVAYDESAGTIDWNSYIYIDYSKEPLTFDIISGGTIKWYCGASDVSRQKVISYSTDNGETWANITATTNTTINVNAGDTIKFKGDNATYYQSYYNNFEGSTATLNIKGNIMSLIDSTGFTTATTLTTNNYNCFYSLFRGCKVVDASNLILPATTLAGSCYDGMFFNCTSLTSAPELPATTLAQSCYSTMFSNCTSLTTAPELPATTLVDYCYNKMFTGCTQLNYIKCLATYGINTNSSTSNWLKSVSSTGTFVKKSGVSWPSGNNGIPNNWTVIEE